MWYTTWGVRGEVVDARKPVYMSLVIIAHRRDTHWRNPLRV